MALYQCRRFLMLRTFPKPCWQYDYSFALHFFEYNTNLVGTDSEWMTRDSDLRKYPTAILKGAIAGVGSDCTCKSMTSLWVLSWPHEKKAYTPIFCMREQQRGRCQQITCPCVPKSPLSIFSRPCVVCTGKERRRLYRKFVFPPIRGSDSATKHCPDAYSRLLSQFFRHEDIRQASPSSIQSFHKHGKRRYHR